MFDFKSSDEIVALSRSSVNRFVSECFVSESGRLAGVLGAAPVACNLRRAQLWRPDPERNRF
jgi:hypothetical protein